MGLLVYFSSATENTKRFVERLGLPAARIPTLPTEAPLEVDEEYVLVVPSYGGGDTKKAVPQPVPRRHLFGKHELRDGLLHRGIRHLAKARRPAAL